VAGDLRPDRSERRFRAGVDELQTFAGLRACREDGGASRRRGGAGAGERGAGAGGDCVHGFAGVEASPELRDASVVAVRSALLLASGVISVLLLRSGRTQA